MPEQVGASSSTNAWREALRAPPQNEFRNASSRTRGRLWSTRTEHLTDTTSASVKMLVTTDGPECRLGVCAVGAEANRAAGDPQQNGKFGQRAEVLPGCEDGGPGLDVRYRAGRTGLVR